MSHALHADLHRNPVSPLNSIDIVRRSSPQFMLGIMGSGRVKMSHLIMVHLRFPRVAFWKYIGNDGFNIIAADEWETGDHVFVNIRPPRPEKRMDYFYFDVPRAYRVGVISGDYSTRVSVSTDEGRGVVTVPGAIDKERLHRAW